MGKEFSATRMRLQTGVSRVLATISPTARILDLGCGNGELARELGRRSFNGLYIGLDFSPILLQHARGKVQPLDPNTSPVFQFIQADLASEDWDESLRKHSPTLNQDSFDLILAFAVLHHLPGRQVRAGRPVDPSLHKRQHTVPQSDAPNRRSLRVGRPARDAMAKAPWHAASGWR